MPLSSPSQPYPTIVHGTRLLPQHFQDLFNFVFDPTVSLTEYRKFKDESLSDAPEDLKSRFDTFVNELKVTKTSGLGISWTAGNIGFGDGTVYLVAAGTGNVTNNATTYVFVNEDGVVTLSTVMPPKVFLLAQVVAASGVITSVTDKRTRYRVTIPFGGDSDVSDVDISSLVGFPDGSALKGLRVNSAEDAIEFYEIPGTNGGAASYSVVARLPVVDGAITSLAAGITAIRSDAALLPTLAADDSRVSVSSVYSYSYPKWRALDGRQGDYNAWVSASNVNPATTPQWWQFTFSSAVTLGRIEYGNRAVTHIAYGAQGQLKDFKIQTLAGSVWTDRLTVASEPARGAGVRKTFALGATVASVEAIRLWVTGVHITSFGYGFIPYVDIAYLQAYSGLTAGSGVFEIESGYIQARQATLKSIAIAGSKCFVSAGYLNENDRILRIDTATRSVDGDFDLGSTIIYSLNTKSSSVAGSYSYSVELTEEFAPVACYDTANKVYVAVGNVIRVYGEITGNLITTVNCGTATQIKDLAISLEQLKLYAVSLAGAVVIIDITQDTIITTLTSVTSAEFAGELNSIAIDDTRDSAYVSNATTNKVLVINTVTNTLVTTISVGTEPRGVALSPTLGKGLVCNASGNLVSVINLTGNTVSASIAMSLVGSNARPIDAAIDETNQKGFVVLQNYNQVLVVNLATNQIEARIAVALSPVSAVWVDATSELYVASENGEITVIKRL